AAPPPSLALAPSLKKPHRKPHPRPSSPHSTVPHLLEEFLGHRCALLVLLLVKPRPILHPRAKRLFLPRQERHEIRHRRLHHLPPRKHPPCDRVRRERRGGSGCAGAGGQHVALRVDRHEGDGGGGFGLLEESSDLVVRREALDIRLLWPGVPGPVASTWPCELTAMREMEGVALAFSRRVVTLSCGAQHSTYAFW
ncbi:unnamed protein product, partial [Closterium sp. NIES-53]